MDILKLFRFPEGETEPGGDEPAPPPSDTVRAPRLPRKDEDVKTVATRVAEKWGLNANITLLWMAPPDFSVKLQQFTDALGARQSAGASQSSRAQALRQMDKEIDAAISSLKIDIQQKFTKPLALAEYSRYGMVKESNGYMLPRDRDNRLAALELTKQAVQVDSTGGTKYDTMFWSQMQTNYGNALNAAQTTDGTVSSNAATKNTLKAEILKVMRALQLVIQANYPATYESIYRDWGWQKENY